MLKQIFKQIWVEKRANVWLFLELFGMFVCLFAITDFFLVKWINYNEPLGHDIENTYRLDIKRLDSNSPDYINPELITDTKTEEVLKLMSQIRQHPGIESVSLSYYANPYARGGLYDGLHADTTMQRINVQGRRVTPEYFEVFRIKNHKGEPLQIPEGMNRQIVVAERTAKKLFPSANDATGKLVYGADGVDISKYEARPAQIVAVSRDFKSEEFGSYNDCFFEIMNPVSLNMYVTEHDVQSADICIRVRAGREQNFEEMFKENMGERLRVNNLYIASIVSFDKLRYNVVGKTIREGISMMLYITIFAMITVSLGIFGAFWLRSRQRTSEIGIRMAMGADKTVIRKEMITESFCLMVVSALPAFIIYINLLYTGILDTYRVPFTIGRVAVVLFITLILMILVIITSTLWPANRAASVQPVDALRDE